jgi:PAS domain S-box-containing protein
MADFHPVALLDLIAFLATLITLVFLWKGRKLVFLRKAKVLFIALILFSLSYNLCLFLEWSGLAEAYEILENFIGALIPMWWAFVTYAFLQEIAQRELRNSEARYQDLYDHAPDMFISVDAATANIIQCNRMLETVTGYSREEILGRPVWNLYPADLHEKIRKAFETFRTRGLVTNLEIQLQCQDGRRVDIILNASAVRDKQGRILHSRSVLRDITEQKQAEQALRFTRFAVDHTSDAAFWMGPDTRFVYVNEAACRKLGYTRNELLNMGTQDIDPDFPIEIWPQHWLELKEKKSLMFETHHRTKAGEIFPVEITENFVEFEGREYNCAFVRDITERKRTEESLRESEDRLQSIIRAAPTGIGVVSNRVLIQVNERLCDMMGYSADELINQNARILYFTDENYEYVGREKYLQIRNQGTGTVETRWKRKDGEIIDILLSSTPIDPDNLSAGVTFTALDITDRKKAEEALREREETIRALVESSRDWIWSIDIQGVHTYCNPAIQDILGYSADELIGKHSLDFMHEDDRMTIEVELPKRMTEKRGWKNLIMRWRHKNGEYRYLESNAVPILNSQGGLIGFRGVDRDITDRIRAEETLRELSQRNEALLTAVPDIIVEVDVNKKYTWMNPAGYEFFGEDALHHEAAEYFAEEQETYAAIEPLFKGDENIVYIESWQRRRDGEKRLLAWWCRVLKDAVGNVIGALSTARDITEHKWAEQEREKLIAELEAKNAELERFTYTVSHDLKSPLITTKGFVGMLEQDLAEGNQELIAEDMQRISHATETMERLLDELLELSRIGRIINPPEEVAFSELVQEALALLSGEPNIKQIHFEINSNLPVVQGDRIRLREVLQNLIENAIKFMGGQPEPRIEIGVRQNEGENEFFVRDNGIGINPRYHEKIFGLFDKLNNEAAGTGIGLAIVKRIVEIHGGRIRVDSEGIGHGSTFCFTLPAKPEGEAAS